MVTWHWILLDGCTHWTLQMAAVSPLYLKGQVRENVGWQSDGWATFGRSWSVVIGTRLVLFC